MQVTSAPSLSLNLPHFSLSRTPTLNTEPEPAGLLRVSTKAKAHKWRWTQAEEVGPSQRRLDPGIGISGRLYHSSTIAISPSWRSTVSHPNKVQLTQQLDLGQWNMSTSGVVTCNAPESSSLNHRVRTMTAQSKASGWYHGCVVWVKNKTLLL